MNFKSWLTIVCLAMGSATYGQQYLSLEQAVEYARKHSYQKQISELEVAKAKALVNETIGIGLPQVNGTVDYQNFQVIPKQVIGAFPFVPGSQPGDLTEVQFSTKYNNSYGFTVSQLVFDGSYLVGLQASKQVLNLFKQQADLSWQEVQANVQSSYYTALVAEENAQTLKQSSKTLEKLYKETQVLHANGLVEESDVQQIEVSFNQLNNALERAQSMAEISKRILKLSIGMDVNEEVELSSSLRLELELVSEALELTGFYVEKNLQYSLALQNEKLQKLNFQAEKSKVLPSISAFYNNSSSIFGNSIDYAGALNNSIPSSLIGVSVKMPLWSSLSRFHKIKQAKLEFEKAGIERRQAEQGLQLEYENARTDYKFQLKNYQVMEKNLKLLESVKVKTEIKYKEGLSSSFELNQAQNNYLNAQGNYTQAILNLLKAKINLNKVLNQL